MRSVEQILALGRVIPVVRIDDVDQAVPVARALSAGGLRAIEVVLRTPVALESIAAIARAVPDLSVGAGTVIDSADLQRSFDAGASFAVSPGCTPSLLDRARARQWPYLPAVASASEVMLCLEYGYELLKYFPASTLGVPALRHLAGPFPSVRFCCTGGITPENARAFLAERNVAAIGASWIAPAKAMASKDWASIERSALLAARM